VKEGKNDLRKIVNGSVWKILEFSSLKISWLANTYFALGSIKSHR
jgi:hypothetical protein